MMDVTIVLALAAVTLLIYVLFFRSSDEFSNQGIRGPRQYPIFGSFFLLMKIGVLKYDKMCKEKYGRVHRETGFGNKILFVYDAEMLKEILIKEHSTFTDHFRSIKMPAPFDRGLTALKGDDWRRVRHAISPTFTSGKLKKMTFLIFNSVKILTEKFEEFATEKKDIDLKDIYGRFSMCVIAETMFGIQIDAMRDENDEFFKNSRKIFKYSGFKLFLFILAMIPGTKQIMEKFGQKALVSEGLPFLVKVVEEAIKERRGKEDQYHDFLSLMLKSEITEEEESKSSEIKSRGLTNEEIIAQSIIFLIAGHETVSIALLYLSYSLARHPEIQEELRSEILRLCDDTPESIYESVSKMTLLDQCVKESLRLYAPAHRTDRQAAKDTIIGNIRIPKGTCVAIPIAEINRDPDLWEDPDTFNPNRFSGGDDAESGKLPFQFLTFGSGPRNCIGMRFAFLEIKLAIVNILRNYRLVVCENTPKEPMEFSNLRGYSSPKHPIILRAEKLD